MHFDIRYREKVPVASQRSMASEDQEKHKQTSGIRNEQSVSKLWTAHSIAVQNPRISCVFGYLELQRQEGSEPWFLP